jgi:hypothetical protein
VILLLVAFLLHTFGLLIRMYLQGSDLDPVTSEERLAEGKLAKAKGSVSGFTLGSRGSVSVRQN